MKTPRPTLVHETALHAGWGESSARWMALRVNEPSAAAQIVTAAVSVPESVRAVILRDKRHTSDAALVAAFEEAAQIAMILDRCARSAPPAVRELGNYVVNHGTGERLMTAAEARTKLTNALAAEDQHIDTSRRVGASERGAICSIAQAAEAHWAAQKAPR
jgi:hypothetical protein